MRTEFTDEDDIVFDHNDSPKELYRATEFLERQLDRMVGSGALETGEDSEAHHAEAALVHLGHLRRRLEQRGAPSTDDVDFERIEDRLSEITSLMDSVLFDLGDHSDVISRFDHLHTNPHEDADELRYDASSVAEDVTAFLANDDDGDDEECMTDGGGYTAEDFDRILDQQGQKYGIRVDQYGYLEIRMLDGRHENEDGDAVYVALNQYAIQLDRANAEFLAEFIDDEVL